jgi:hypothetical protein
MERRDLQGLSASMLSGEEVSLRDWKVTIEEGHRLVR